MKKTTFLFTFLACLGLLFSTVYAQTPCTVDTSQSIPGIYPNPMPTGCVNAPYSEVVQFVFPIDTTVQGFTIPFDSFEITGVANLPTGLMYLCNNTACKFYPSAPGQPARGCVLVFGLPTVPAGPGNQVVVAVNAWATAPIIGVQMVAATYDVELDIFAAATAAFSSAAAGNTVTFTNTSTVATTYAWDFGDGNTSTMQSPIHTYGAVGNYNVCLLADNGNCADSTCMTVSTGCAAPTAAFGQTANNLLVTFADQSLAQGPAWFWDFGDGNTSTTQNPIHAYAAPGTYQVCLTVADSCGTDSSCTPITVVCPAPVSAFTFALVQGSATFTDMATGSGTITYFWDFGDGNTSTMQNPTHVYLMSGNYQICQTVTDDCGSDSVCFAAIVTIVGLEEGDGLSAIQVYPNPNAGTFTLTGMRELNDPMTIRVTDVVGKTLHTQLLDAGTGAFKQQIALQNAAAGMYFVQVQTGRAVRTVKVRVE